MGKPIFFNEIEYIACIAKEKNGITTFSLSDISRWKKKAPLHVSRQKTGSLSKEPFHYHMVLGMPNHWFKDGNFAVDSITWGVPQIAPNCNHQSIPIKEVFQGSWA